MKILYIVEEIPFPIDKNGSTLINYHVIKNFAKNSKLDILTFGEQSDGLLFNEKLNIQLNKTYLIKNNMNFIFFKKLLAIILFKPSFYFLVSSNFLNKLKKIRDENNYDIIFVDSINMEIYTKSFCNNVCISLHDSLSFLYDSIYRNTRNFKKYYYNYLSRIYRKHELMILKNYKKIFFVSKNDYQFLTNEIKHNVHIIPNGVEFPKKLVLSKVKSDSIVFSGVMNYLPNEDACIHFIKYIFPLVKLKIPNVKFKIVGRHPSKKILKYNSSDIVVVGEVENIQAELSKSIIYVCPLRFGAGLKNKILEASSAGLPIVCTEISVNGIDLKNSEHLLISKNDQKFANNIVTLFYDNDLRNRLANNSLNQLKNIYSWNNIINEYNKVLF